LLLAVRLPAPAAAPARPRVVFASRRARLRLGPARAWPAALLAALAVDLPLLEGTTANAEIFMAPLALAGLALAWPSIDLAPRGEVVGRARALILPFAGGLCLGLAVLFKAVALADTVAALLLVWTAPHRRVASDEWRVAGWHRPSSHSPPATNHGAGQGRAGSQLWWRARLALAAGVALPLFLTVGAFAAQGAAALGALGWATIGYNAAYVRSGGTFVAQAAPGAAWLRLAPPLVSLALLLLAAALYVRATRRAIAAGAAAASATSRHAWHRAALGLWAACALAGAVSGGRPHLHYFLQVAAPLACLVGAALPALLARRGVATSAILAVLCALLVALASLLAARGGPTVVARDHRLAAYYAGAWWLVTGRQTSRDFAADLDPRVLRTLDVAAYLRRRAAQSPEAKPSLLVWGNAPWIYYLSGLRPATRFTSTDYQPPIPGAGLEIARAVQGRRAGALVVLDWQQRPRAIAAAIAAGYRPLDYLDGAAILVLPSGRR
jgi:hypothetical protein